MIGDWIEWKLRIKLNRRKQIAKKGIKLNAFINIEYGHIWLGIIQTNFESSTVKRKIHIWCYTVYVILQAIQKEDKQSQSTVHFSCKWLLKEYEPIKPSVFFNHISSCAVPYACTMLTAWTDGPQQWKAKRFSDEKRVTILLTAWLESSFYIIICNWWIHWSMYYYCNV